MLNINCPGCGITRAIFSLVHGKFYQSILYNPMGIVLVLMLLFVWIALFIRVFLKKDINFISVEITRLIMLFFVIGLFTQWVLDIYFRILI